MPAGQEPIGTRLIAEGIATKEAIEQALTSQQRAPDRGLTGRLCSLLHQVGVPERALIGALSRQLGVPGLVLSASTLDLSALGLIPRVVAERLCLLPVDLDEHTITMACADPDDEDLLSQVAFATGRQVQPLLALEGVVRQMAGFAYDAYAQGSRQMRGAAAEGKVTDGLVSLEVVRPDVPQGSSLPADEGLAMEEPGWDVPMPSTVAITPSVLIVDDDEAIRGLLTRVLQMDNYDVTEAAHGRAALEQIQASPPRLIVLDAMLPEIHGFTICQQLKASASYAHIPVVMISAVYKGWEHARDIHEVHGADRFIEKPFDVHYLRRVVSELLGAPVPEARADPAAMLHIEQVRQAAQAAYERRDEDQALALAEQWLDLASFDPVPHLLRGNVFHRRRDFGNALLAFERAATFGPELFGAQKNLALVYERLGFVRRAFERWRLARQHAPDDTVRQTIDQRLKTQYASYLS